MSANQVEHRRVGRLLVAYSNASNYVSTTAEYLDSISRYSEFEVAYVHVTNDAELEFGYQVDRHGERQATKTDGSARTVPIPNATTG